MKGKYGEGKVLTYFITGWYGNLLHEVFKCFNGWKRQGKGAEARAQTWLLVGPWAHNSIGDGVPFGDVDFGSEVEVEMLGVHVRWYDQQLRGMDTGIDDEALIRIFVMEENVWCDEHEWPLVRVHHTKFYLHSRGRANSLDGDDVLSLEPLESEFPNSFTYDSEDPAPTLSGQSMFIDNNGPRDRRPVGCWDDVLVYSTLPFDEDLEVTGPIALTLYTASADPDTDFTVTPVDAPPKGSAIHICEGIVRARFHESYGKPTWIEPKSIYKYKISLWETSNVF